MGTYKFSNCKLKNEQIRKNNSKGVEDQESTIGWKLKKKMKF